MRQTVSKWEKGLSVPDAQTLIQIAQVLETPVSALLGEKIPEEKEEEKLQIMAEKLERINACMGEAIPWAPGLPLRGDGYETPFYMKD